jgi:hypothetical protein
MHTGVYQSNPEMLSRELTVFAGTIWCRYFFEGTATTQVSRLSNVQYLPVRKIHAVYDHL